MSNDIKEFRTVTRELHIPMARFREMLSELAGFKVARLHIRTKDADMLGWQGPAILVGEESQPTREPCQCDPFTATAEDIAEMEAREHSMPELDMKEQR